MNGLSGERSMLPRAEDTGSKSSMSINVLVRLLALGGEARN